MASDGHSPEPVATPPGTGFEGLRATMEQIRQKVEEEREAAKAGVKKTGRRRQSEPAAPPAAAEAAPEPPSSSPSGLTSIAAMLPTKRGRPPGTRDEREQITAYLQDFARELNDQAPLSASVSRALNAFKHANISRERWEDFLYQARAITQERSATIIKRVDDPAKVIPAKNKMAYFFAVFDDLLGLRIEESSPSAASGYTT